MIIIHRTFLNIIVIPRYSLLVVFFGPIPRYLFLVKVFYFVVIRMVKLLVTIRFKYCYLLLFVFIIGYY